MIFFKEKKYIQASSKIKKKKQHRIQYCCLHRNFYQTDFSPTQRFFFKEKTKYSLTGTA